MVIEAIKFDNYYWQVSSIQKVSRWEIVIGEFSMIDHYY